MARRAAFPEYGSAKVCVTPRWLRVAGLAGLIAGLSVPGCVSSGATGVTIAESKERVKGCQLLGTIGGGAWRDAEKKNMGADLAKQHNVPADRVVVLNIEGADDEAYYCPAPGVTPTP